MREMQKTKAAKATAEWWGMAAGAHGPSNETVNRMAATIDLPIRRLYECASGYVRAGYVYIRDNFFSGSGPKTNS